MIPQRNLSLLANRLHKEHGGRRIPESVLERDYCLAWFLAGLSQSQFGKLLIFKGGTALKRCHFGDYRFSEDLDFTLARSADFAEIRDGLEEVYQHVAQASGIRFAFDREDRQGHINSHTFYLSYQGPLPNPNTVKVDITISETVLFPVEQKEILRAYEEFSDIPEGRAVAVYSTTNRKITLLDSFASLRERGCEFLCNVARLVLHKLPEASGNVCLCHVDVVASGHGRRAMPHQAGRISSIGVHLWCPQLRHLQGLKHE